MSIYIYIYIHTHILHDIYIYHIICNIYIYTHIYSVYRQIGNLESQQSEKGGSPDEDGRWTHLGRGGDCLLQWWHVLSALSARKKGRMGEVALDSGYIRIYIRIYKDISNNAYVYMYIHVYVYIYICLYVYYVYMYIWVNWSRPH